MKRNTSQNFWKHVSEPDENGCRVWMLSRDSRGYGHVGWNGKLVRTHRLAWTLAHGTEIPSGMNVLHTCDNRPCCNPDHLFIGTRQDNIDDMITKGRQPRAPGGRNGKYTHPESTPRGEQNGNSKLSDAQVAEILRLHATGEYSQRALAERFGVERHTIGSVVNGKTRRDIWLSVKSMFRK